MDIIARGMAASASGGGSSYSAGTGIEINNNQISIDDDVVETVSDVTTKLAQKQEKLDSTSANANVIAPLYVDTGELRLALGNGLHKVVDDLEVEVKSNGGILLDANGVSVDTSLIQSKLTAGTGISIDATTNTISATGGSSVSVDGTSIVNNSNVLSVAYEGGKTVDTTSSVYCDLSGFSLSLDSNYTKYTQSLSTHPATYPDGDINTRYNITLTFSDSTTATYTNVNFDKAFNCNLYYMVLENDYNTYGNNWDTGVKDYIYFWNMFGSYSYPSKLSIYLNNNTLVGKTLTGFTITKVSQSTYTQFNKAILPVISNAGSRSDGKIILVGAINGSDTSTDVFNLGDGSGTGNYNHIEGYSMDTAISYSNSGNYYYSHCEGQGTYCNNSAYASHTEGYRTLAYSSYQHVQGKNNIQDASGTYVDIVGGGTVSARANISTLDWSGNLTIAGTLSSNGSDYAEFFEWVDGNPDNEDRVGYIVKLNGSKIELADSDDDILGIVSGIATVIGDDSEWEWQGKYLKDEFGRVIVDMVDEFDDEEQTKKTGTFPHKRINPDYNEDQNYTNRRNRPEWDTIGMMGKLYVRDDGTAVVNGYVKAVNGIATASEERTNMRVMERVNDNIVKVCLK